MTRESTPSTDANPVRIHLTDDPSAFRLRPETLAAARALLNWRFRDLAAASGVDVEEIRRFEEYGVLLGTVAKARLRAALSAKLYFGPTPGLLAVCLKRAALAALGPGSLEIAPRLRRRPRL
jgi:hypothetical protein